MLIIGVPLLRGPHTAAHTDRTSATVVPWPLSRPAGLQCNAQPRTCAASPLYPPLWAALLWQRCFGEPWLASSVMALWALTLVALHRVACMLDSTPFHPARFHAQKISMRTSQSDDVCFRWVARNSNRVSLGCKVPRSRRRWPIPSYLPVRGNIHLTNDSDTVRTYLGAPALPTSESVLTIVSSPRF